MVKSMKLKSSEEILEEEIALAWRIARNAFAGRKDLGGEDYIQHMERMCLHLPRGAHPVAILYDLLENCPEWTEKALRCLFSKEIVDAVAVLTRPEDESYMTYIQRIGKSSVSWVSRVKLAALEDNMDVRRMKKLRDIDIDRLKKYHEAYKYLRP